MAQMHNPDEYRTPSPSKDDIQKVAKANIGLLSFFTVLYLVPLFLTSSMRISLIAVGVLLIVFGVGLVTAISKRRAPGELREISKAEATFIGVTSFLEFVAVIIGLAIGFISDVWWPFGLLLVGSVVLHFFSLTLAYRRPADYFAFACVVVAFVLLIVNPLSPLWDLWALVGAIVAATTALYVVELARTLRKTQKPMPTDA